MMGILLAMVLFFLLYTGVGMFVARWISELDQAERLGVTQRIFHGFLLGAGVTTYLEFLLSIIGIEFRFTLLALAVVAVVGWARSSSRLRQIVSKPTKQAALFWIPVAGVLVLLFTRSLSRVIYAYDALAFWVPKMIALFIDQRVNITGLEKFNHPEYPLLMPLISSNVFTLLGRPDEVAAKAVIFMCTAAFVVLVGVFLLSKHVLWKALFWIGLLFSLFIFREHVAGEYVGTADIFVGMYIAAGSIALLQKRPATAVVFWLLSAWSKSEGLVFVLVGVALLFLLYKRLRPYLIGVSAFFLAPWQVYMKLNKVDTSQYFKFDEIYARPYPEYAAYSVHAFREEFRNITKWNLVFFFYLSAVLTNIRRILHDKPLFVITSAMVAQLVMYMVIFTITPEEQATFIAASVSRLTLHLAPTALVVASTLLAQEQHELS